MIKVIKAFVAVAGLAMAITGFVYWQVVPLDACCRAPKLATTPSLSMHMRSDVVLGMMTAWSYR